jgi:predicted transcriptional regulator YdeE
MQFTLVQQPFFTIAGLAVRTTNKDGQAMKDITALWQHFMQNQVQQTIANRLDDDIVCMYTNYDSDFTAPYTVVLGCRVSSTEGLPQGLFFKTVPVGTYRVYLPVGPLQNSIADTWVHIWQTAIPRAYTADFDVYKTDGSAEIYLSVNE